jgi:hypothetical protein
VKLFLPAQLVRLCCCPPLLLRCQSVNINALSPALHEQHGKASMDSTTRLLTYGPLLHVFLNPELGSKQRAAESREVDPQVQAQCANQ